MKKIFNKQTLAILIAFSIITTPSNVLAATLKIGSRGTEVSYVQSALKELGFFSYHTATGYFGTITQNAVINFQRANNLKVDGIVGSETMQALTSLVPKTETYNKLGAVDWFSSVQYIFPREGNAVVTDVLTQKSFNVKRTFGTNHADVEPLTSTDAQIIKEIWGGWSWERRAVVVNVDGTLLAGSMTAYPHAGVDNAPSLAIVNNRSGNYGRGQNFDSVKNNGVDGHMDIHFLNSRTHSTNVVQKVHQDKVSIAHEYINKNY